MGPQNVSFIRIISEFLLYTIQWETFMRYLQKQNLSLLPITGVENANVHTSNVFLLSCYLLSAYSIQLIEVYDVTKVKMKYW